MAAPPSAGAELERIVDETTVSLGQTLQQGTADIFVSLFQLMLNVIVISFQVVWTALFSGIFPP